MSWMQRLKRVFHVDIEHYCGAVALIGLFLADRIAWTQRGPCPG